MREVVLTAIVTEFTPGLRFPKPQPGENMAQLLIRKYPDKWNNLIALLKNDFNASEDVWVRLRQGDIGAVAPDSAIMGKVELWMNYRLPTHGRTFQGLADLREDLEKYPKAKVLIKLKDIIWARRKDPSKDKEAETLAKHLDVRIHNIDAEESLSLDYKFMLDYLHGDYLWILPGGSKLEGPITSNGLLRMISFFVENPEIKLCRDGFYSTLYRTRTLRELIVAGKKLSFSQRENTRILKEAGANITLGNNLRCGLCELEPIFRRKQIIFSLFRRM